jgi:hypothetical protein
MSDYKPGDVVARLEVVDDRQPGMGGGVVLRGHDYGYCDEADPEELAPWPDAERMAHLEAVAKAARDVGELAPVDAWDALAIALRALDGDP